MFPNNWSDPLSSLPETGLGLPFWGPITWGQIVWAGVLTVPPLIVLLYFLKLKRQPLEVPSTYLWHKSIEDLHVNSIWQRLRRSLLLFLQLLLVALVLLALAGPAWRGTELPGNRFVFLIDNSASMSATDAPPSRLEEAKRRVGELIDQMKSGDTAMIVSFSDVARVEQSFTDNRKLLRHRLASIRQTQRPTSWSEALKVASGLVNPGQSRDAPITEDPETTRAELFIFSDGRFADVKDFSFGNLNPTYVPIGDPAAPNVAITAFGTRRREDKPDMLQAFGRVENFGPKPARVEVELYLNETLAEADDVKAVEVPPGEAQGVAFDLEMIDTGVLKLKLGQADPLEVDNQAWAAVNKPRRTKVLLVAPEASDRPGRPGNEPLWYALTTGRAAELADVTSQTPAWLSTPEYRKAAAGGLFDLMIFDRCAPPAEESKPVLPQSNTWFIGSLPPGAGWTADPKVDVPQIIDTERGHPLMQLAEVSDVLIAEATPLKLPPGATSLIDSSSGPLLAIAPRDSYEDLVLAFELVGTDRVGSNWHVRLSFPLFVMDLLTYFGGRHDPLATGSVRPGQPVNLRTDTPAAELSVVTPSGQTVAIRRGKLDTFLFAGTDQTGIYEVRRGPDAIERFAVNLFDAVESDIKPRPEIKAGHVAVAGKPALQPKRREGWKWLVLAAFGVLLFEWYIYNRRVYL
jgi:hypothetical protein